VKNAIFYFSATGNSLMAARCLAEGLPEPEVLNMANAVQKHPGDPYECIGLVFPVYMFGLPLIVRSFLETLNASSQTYIFAVATYGGLAGNALPQAAAILRKRGLRLSAGLQVLMPGNYTPLYGAIPLARQEELLRKAEARIGEFCALIKEKKVRGPAGGVSLFGWLYEGIYRLGSPRIPQADKNFSVDANCNGCGVCRKVCPVCNIRMFGGKPAWQHACQQCMACLQWCPQEAIQYKQSTRGRKRYRNPRVQLKDFVVL